MSNQNWTKMWEEGEDLDDVETFEPLKQYITGSFEEETDEDTKERTDRSGSRENDRIDQSD